MAATLVGLVALAVLGRGPRHRPPRPVPPGAPADPPAPPPELRAPCRPRHHLGRRALLVLHRPRAALRLGLRGAPRLSPRPPAPRRRRSPPLPGGPRRPPPCRPR